MPRLRYLSGAIIAAFAFASAAQATDFSKVVVFGDSLSDNGNLSLAMGSTTPLRYTTNPGLVAIEHVAAGYGFTLQPSVLGGTDYAWDGAGVVDNSPGTPSLVPTLSAQIGGYLAAGAADPNALYSVWGGANDIFYHATMVAYSAETPTQAQTAIAVAGGTEVNLIGQLQAAGAKNIIVFNLPDIGTTPEALAQDAVSPGAAASLTGLSLIYNGQLNAGLAKLNTGIIPVNTFRLIHEIMANPAQYGFTNVTTPACGAGSTALLCGPAGSGLPYTYAAGTDQTYLFADGVHPTTAAHAMLGQVVLSELMAPGQISMLAEAPLAAADAQTGALQHEMTTDLSDNSNRAFANVNFNRQTFDATQDSPKTTSNNANLTVGVNAAAGDNVSLGVALGAGNGNADVADNMGGYKLATLMTTGYAMYHSGGGYIGTYLGYGQVSFTDVHRRFAIGPASRTESGKTEGSQLLGALTAGWMFQFNQVKTGPFATVELQRIRIGGYNETSGDSTAMWFGRQERKAEVSTLGWRVDGSFQAGGHTLKPYAELAWHHDGKAKADAVLAGLTTMNGQFMLDGFTADSSWATASLGISGSLSSKVSGWIGYQGRFADHNQKLNALNLGVRIAL